MIQRCLLIADDMTGGADSGAQFAKRGLRTVMISPGDHPDLDLGRFVDRDALVINTDSRGLPSDEAFRLLRSLVKGYRRESFPVVYMKIDSTLRGNIGAEVDAILEEIDADLGFFAPSFPEQGRTLVDGIMMVRGTPLAMTEVSKDAVFPVTESHVVKLLESQSLQKIGRIDLPDVAGGGERLGKTVEDENRKGNRILVFDAVERRDLAHIAEIGFARAQKPLFIGSAGLAQEVAKRLAPWVPERAMPPLVEKSARKVMIISGSASKVANGQVSRIADWPGLVSFELGKSLILSPSSTKPEAVSELSARAGQAFARGHVLLRSCQERLSGEATAPPLRLEIPRLLGKIALEALRESNVSRNQLTLILVGGDTTRGVLNALGAKGLNIVDEIMDGVILSRLIDGDWDGLQVATKAGAFGSEDILKHVLSFLEEGIPDT